MILYKTFG